MNTPTTDKGPKTRIARRPAVTAGPAAATAVAGVTVACLLAGCSGTTSDSPADAGSHASSHASTHVHGDDPTGPSESGAPSSRGNEQARLLRAGATAVHAVPHSTLISIETERGGWEAQVVTADGTEHEMDLSGSGRRVTSGPTTKHEDAQTRAEHRRRVQAAKLGYRTAAHTIASAVPGARITELNLDTYRGATVWEADAITGSGTGSGTGVTHSVKVDVRTGKVLADRTGRDD